METTESVERIRLTSTLQSCAPPKSGPRRGAGKYDSKNRSPLTVTCRSELRNLQETKELSMNGNHTRVWPCVQHKHPRDLVLERARAKRAPAEAIFPHLPHCRLPTSLPLFPMRRLPFHMHVLFFNEFIFNSVRFKRKEVSHEVAIYHRKLPGSWAKLCGKVDRAKGNVFDCLPGRGFNYESVSIFGPYWISPLDIDAKGTALEIHNRC
jgi:hypothetical protein